MDSHQSHHLRLHHLLALTSMASLRRLIGPLLVVLLGSGSAHASIPATFNWYVSGVTACGTGSKEAMAECGMRKSYGLPPFGNPSGLRDFACGPTTSQVASNTANPTTYSTTCNFIANGGYSYSGTGGALREAVPTACPANSTSLSPAQCQCNTGFEENAGKNGCVLQKSRWEKACEQNAGKRFELSMRGRSATGGCMNEINRAGSPIDGDTGGLPDAFGCAVRLVTDGDSISARGDDGVWWTSGEFRVTGGTCVATGEGGVPNDAPPETEEGETGKPTPCPEGRVVGINGALACADNDPKGGIEGTDTGKITNPDGTSVETKKETKCDGGRCVTETTETKRDVNGLVVGTGTKKEEQSIRELCSKEPGNKVCASVGMGNGEGGGGFSGDCKAGFSAKGDDPVVNAMALEQHTRNCKLFGVDEDPQSTANKALSGEDGQNTDKMKSDAAGTPITINTFDSGGRGWGRTCPPDPAIALPFAGGRTFSVPFSKICMPLSILAQAGVALTLLASFAWVMGGKS